jgi:type IV pilus assembly protein PilF
MAYLLKIFTIFSILFFLAGCSSNRELKTQEKRADLFYAKGTTHLMKKEYTEALDHLLEAKKLRPNHSKTLNNLAMAYYFKDYKDKAIKILQKTLDIDPKNSDARNNLASFYIEKGMLEEAKKEYFTVLNDLIYKNQYRTYYNLALINFKEGNKKEGIKKLLKSVEINEDHCPAHHLLGTKYFKSGSYTKALSSFKSATMGKCYKNPQPHYLQALSLISLNQNKRALFKLKEVIDNFPKSKYAILAARKLRAIKVNQLRTEKMSLKGNYRSPPRPIKEIKAPPF